MEVVKIAGEVMLLGRESANGADSDSSWSSNSNLNVDDHPEYTLEEGEGESSGVTSDGSDTFCDDGNGRSVRVDDDDVSDRSVKNKFVNIMLGLGFLTTVETVYKNFFSSLSWQAKLHVFLIFSRVMEKISRGCGQVKYAWYGGSKDEIKSILKYGFASKGRGICLSPFYSPSASLRGAVADENGLCHLILCRVLLGKSELVSPSSQQRCPSSEEFHSGVDSFSSPSVYMIWSTNMNTHVVPQYVVSFRPPVPVPVQGREQVGNVAAAPAMRQPSSPWMPFPVLLSELGRIVPQNTIRMLQKHHCDHRAGKMTRLQLIQKLRQLVGDHVLFTTITSYRKKLDASKSLPNNSNNKFSPRKLTPNNCNNLVAPQLGTSRKFAPSSSEAASHIDASRKFAASNRSHVALSQHVKPAKSSSNKILKKMKKLQAAGPGCTDDARVSDSRIMT